MFDSLILEQVRADPDITGMLTTYDGRVAFFYQKSPPDSDREWAKPGYPRADYNIDISYDPERKTAGLLAVNVWCTSESRDMPEDIAARFVSLISGTFYTARGEESICAVWNRSDAFSFEKNAATVKNDTSPEVFGITILFDLLSFPSQLTTNPDPIEGANFWIGREFPGLRVIAQDDMPPIWKPTDETPALYWRFIGANIDPASTYAVNWYNGQFAAHVIADSVTERNKWTKAIVEKLMVEQEVLLADASPMFINHLQLRHGADPLREGQILMTGRYGVLAQARKEYAQNPLNHAIREYRHKETEGI